MRYYSLVRIIDRRYPGFWDDLGDLCRSMREAQITTREAVVCQLPPVNTAETPTDATGTRSVALMTEMKPPQRDAAHQTTPEKREEMRGRERRVELPRTMERERSGEGRRMDPMLPLGCWNCGGSHRYASCPLPRRSFCFGCGHAGETVRTCPRCGLDYVRGALEIGAPSEDEPKRKDRSTERAEGHLARSALQTRKRPNGCRRSPRPARIDADGESPACWRGGSLENFVEEGEEPPYQEASPSSNPLPFSLFAFFFCSQFFFSSFLDVFFFFMFSPSITPLLSNFVFFQFFVVVFVLFVVTLLFCFFSFFSFR